jgi:hypothetical protein
MSICLRLNVQLSVVLLICLMTGCMGNNPLIEAKVPAERCPWCGPNQRVKFGQRVVRYAGVGKIWQNFLVDDKGKVYDPREMADDVWSYLERTGDARKIEKAYRKDGYYPRMMIVSIKPMIVILETNRNITFAGKSQERYYWVANIHASATPLFQNGLRWFSPDLKQRPEILTFSEEGVAEILLPKNGKLQLIRDGDTCQTRRV